MKVDEEFLTLQNFPKVLLDHVLNDYEECVAGKYISTELDDSMFIYNGEYNKVDDWERENSGGESDHYVLREKIEELVCENIAPNIENKGFVTRSPENFIIKRHGVIFNTRISYIYSEGTDIWSWVPTFFDLFDVLKKDDLYYDHYEIMREVCLEVLNGNYECDVKNILNKHIKCYDPQCYLVIKHAHGKRELHPIVFHLLLKQIMISEEISYRGLPGPMLGAKLPVKAFYYIKELDSLDFIKGLQNSFNWDSIARAKGIKVWNPRTLR